MVLVSRNMEYPSEWICSTILATWKHKYQIILNVILKRIQSTEGKDMEAKCLPFCSHAKVGGSEGIPTCMRNIPGQSLKKNQSNQLENWKTKL